MNQLAQDYNNTQISNNILENDCPRVWIGCLSAYNEGILHGKWVDVPEYLEDLIQLKDEILKTSPGEHPEEWEIFDSEGFGPFDTHYLDLETAVLKAKFLKRIETAFENRTTEKDAFWIWIEENYCGANDIQNEEELDQALEKFQDAFQGVYQSEEIFAETYFQDCYDEDEKGGLFSKLDCYIDWSRVWKDEFCCNACYDSASNPNGSGVFIFCNQ